VVLAMPFMPFSFEAHLKAAIAMISAPLLNLDLAAISTIRAAPEKRSKQTKSASTTAVVKFKKRVQR
jgi:hypothetical protein